MVRRPEAIDWGVGLQQGFLRCEGQEARWVRGQCDDSPGLGPALTKIGSVPQSVSLSLSEPLPDRAVEAI